jgi:thymidylate kinase
LELVRDLCAALDAAAVRYCHWKSTEALDRSATGENDLDLLVDRRDAARLGRVIRHLGFREAIPPRWKEVPGVFHAYGLDEPSGRLVHLHGHYDLVVGDDMTKNYRLPVEEAYLDSSTCDGLFPVPSPEFELVLLVVRLVLKHAGWDAIATRQGAHTASEDRELRFLLGRADPDRLRRTVRAHLPFIDDSLWARCLRAVQPRCPLVDRIATARRLQRALAPYGRRSVAADTALKVWRRGRGWIRSRTGRRSPPRPRLKTGAVVAVVGGDGAGKSTLVGSLAGWLSGAVLAMPLHLGRPRPSATTAAADRLWRLRRPRGSSRASQERVPEPRSEPGIARMTWDVLTARDRYLEARRARTLASGGAVVICDRYPLPQVRTMDGQVLGRSHARRGRLASSLIALERRFYQRMPSPDVLIVLRLDPEVAVRRRTDEEPAFVRRRSAEVWTAEWSATDAIVIDAGRSADEVASDARSALWSRL